MGGCEGSGGQGRCGVDLRKRKAGRLLFTSNERKGDDHVVRNSSMTVSHGTNVFKRPQKRQDQVRGFLGAP